MNERQFKNLLEKQKQNKLSENEKEFLDKFEKTLLSRNKETLFVNKAHKKQVKKEIYKKINYKIKVKKDYNWLNIAASITLLVSLAIGFSYYNGYFNIQNKVVLDTENIILQFENGKTQIINGDEELELVDADKNVIGKQSGNQLVYANDLERDALVYNTLMVPYGKRFKIKLSDGTIVHLNAGTSLRYPIKFVKDKNREVFLKGEAFFDVAKDVEHPFIVNANEVDVRVLGTKFNVSSYDEDEDINTVLVEGAVSLYSNETEYNPKTSVVLNPGFKAAWNKAKNHIDISDADIEMSTAWIDGRIIFKHMPFDKITKKLERHYNVKITNNNASLGEDFVTATFDIESIEDVFKVINEIHPIDYTITDNQIIIAN